jgi:hypothetical protein
MIKKHIVLFETKDYEWIAYSTTGADAKRILNVNKNYNIFYIFECDISIQYPYTMKLRAPFYKYYNCKIINKYKEEIFNEDDEYIIISYKDENDSSICFDVFYYHHPVL